MPRYQVKFNWSGEVKEYHTTAPTKGVAKRNCVYRLSKDLRRAPGLLFKVYDGRKNNHSVKEVD
ncbi:hypothetical protein LCGC14_1290930 [marine sediment metagenome]|uniref:Uncharacterized protein n=1 Tax=marine sediment metagenome TaxID=412755 RepID=A0A0F9LDB1_9ZZZZ